MADKKKKSYVCPPKCESFKIPKKILCEELKVIRERRKTVCCESSDETPADAKSDPQDEKSKLKKNLVGLALSGGGIRSDQRPSHWGFCKDSPKRAVSNMWITSQRFPGADTSEVL
jgi:hypothetical protein